MTCPEDFKVCDHGTTWVLTPVTPWARDYTNLNLRPKATETLWLSRGGPGFDVVVASGHVPAAVDGILEAGGIIGTWEQ